LPALRRNTELTIAAMSGNRHHALIDPDARTGLIEEMKQVFEVAEQLNCQNIMMLSDVLNGDSAVPIEPRPAEEKREAIVEVCGCSPVIRAPEASRCYLNR
jgi:sugar phosphate isomerase/epimerase